MKACGSESLDLDGVLMVIVAREVLRGFEASDA